MSATQLVPSKAALTSARLGFASVALVAVGAGLAWLGVLAPFHGFILMVLGMVVGIVGVVTSIVGLVATGQSKGRSGRSHALRGLLASAAVVSFVLMPALRFGDVPRINDITTDFDDPPKFVTCANLDDNRGRDMSYPGESFAAQQQKGYPDLSHLIIMVPPVAAFDEARSALETMPRTHIVAEDRPEGRIEAVQTSALFHFGDDVVVRIRPFEGGSKIDVRSKSRNGKGDLGVNAARIRDLFARIKAE